MSDETKRPEVDPVRRVCAQIAAAEYLYWKNAPLPDDPMIRAMHTAAMGAASNICVSIFLGKSPEEHAKDLVSGQMWPVRAVPAPDTGVIPDPAQTDPPAKG